MMVKRMSKSTKYDLILEEAKKTNKKLKELHEDAGTYETPVDIDLVKTTKSMFYEKVIEIIKGGN